MNWNLTVPSVDLGPTTVPSQIHIFEFLPPVLQNLTVFANKIFKEIIKANEVRLYRCYLGFSGGSVVKNPPAMQETQETWVWSLGWENPLEKEMQPIPAFLPGESHGERSLAGHSPWDHSWTQLSNWTTTRLTLIQYNWYLCKEILGHRQQTERRKTVWARCKK